MKALQEYYHLWKLIVNASKTKIVIFSRGKIRQAHNFTYEGSRVDIVDSFTYLGVDFNYNGKFKKGINKQISQARKALFGMRTAARELHLQIDIQIELFDKLVILVLLYGCEVWSFGDLKPIEIFHRMLLKRQLAVTDNTPDVMVYGETGTHRLQDTVSQRRVGYWCRLISGSQNKLCHNVQIVKILAL